MPSLGESEHKLTRRVKLVSSYAFVARGKYCHPRESSLDALGTPPDIPALRLCALPWERHSSSFPGYTSIMRISVRWLQQYLKTDVPLPRLLDLITNCGLEVEQVIDLGMVSGKLIVGEILKIEAVEGAGKVRLCTVMADEKEPLKIICGAQNIKEGDYVPVAKFGMTFPDGMVLKPRKIMGIEGQGMLCSAKELGVAEDADGIWLLPHDYPIAEPVDALIEISITPNRPDALSVIGVARDLAAKINALKDGRSRASFEYPSLQMEESVTEKTESAVRVTLQAREDCGRYTARVVRGVKVGPSPRWMQIALEGAGLRPINNLVDITNYVLLEMGHPLHAFDLDKVSGQQIIVRTAQPGEKIKTLDDATQELAAGDLLICDALKPIALAGIMGGGNSEISEGTTNVLIESAWFRPSTIRRTAKRLDKSTDASYRFERGTDHVKLTAALNRVAQLMCEIAGGTVLKGIVDVVGVLPRKEPVTVRIARVNKVLGLDLSGRDIVDVLTPLGYAVPRSDREVIQVEVPPHRPDVSIEVDVIEEVGRILGYDRVAEKGLVFPGVYRQPAPIQRVREQLASAAISQGLTEAINFSFVSEGANALVGLADQGQVQVLNPITSDQKVMRRSMLPSLLQNVLHNFNHGVEEVALFELGHSYAFLPEDDAPRDRKNMTPPAVETPWFAAVVAGGGKPNWKEAESEADFYQVKGLAEYLLGMLGIGKLVVESSDAKWLHPGRSARFLVKGQPVATFGEIHPAILKELSIKRRVAYLEIPLDGPILDVAGLPKIGEPPRFPAITRDIALVVDSTVRSLDLERTIRKAAKNLLAGVKLFDVYEGEHVGPGRKSLAYSLVYRAEDRTLKEEEVTAAHGEVLSALEREHKATLRS
ncbi:phenylalanine--tRNA ligase subunit beta [bacterium]|nr:phenylalanine--tRNA ligase subunit beta [bacterium]